MKVLLTGAPRHRGEAPVGTEMVAPLWRETVQVGVAESEGGEARISRANQAYWFECPSPCDSE